MKKVILYLFVLLTVSSCRGEKYNTGDGSVREPVFAGKFYPADSKVLTATLTYFFNDAKASVSDSVIAIIVPHAGYIYSGQIAADGFSQVRNNKCELVVILGTNHTTAGFSGVSVYPRGAFVTPIGNAVVDNKSAEALIREEPSITSNLAVHEKEHSIEVQVPFIKYLFPDAKILPVIVSDPGMDAYTKFGRALAKVLRGKKALIVASSDLSHYPAFEDAIKTDSKTLKIITGMNLTEINTELQKQIETGVPGLSTCACGEAPILAAIAAAKELGAGYGSVISYSNSGFNPVGEVSKVVGYGSVAICKGRKEPTTDTESNLNTSNPNLAPSDKTLLLRHARKTLEQYFETQTVPLPRGSDPLLKMKRGAFVTLKKNGELRGCIGHMAEDIPLYTVIGSMALNAAFNDSRFNPLSQDELSAIKIEISVLTPFTRVGSADDITLGRDGVIVKKDYRQAVFLPQVATETGWSKEVFLDQLCLKAGLNPGDWKDAELYTFRADVFAE